MNKKLIKALSIFVIAGAISTGAAFGITACSKGNDDPGKQEQTDAVTGVSAQASKTSATVGEEVTLTATVTGTGTFSQEVTWAITAGNGTLNGNKLTVTEAGTVKVQATSKTDTTKKSNEVTVTFAAAVAQFEIPAAADDLIVEGYGETTVQLSETKTSHAIDKTAIKVYLNDGEGKTKKTEVPAENVVLGIKDPENHDCEWSGLKANGAYKISVSLQGAKVAAGSVLQADDFASMITINVNNAIKADSLAVKAGAGVVTTQPKSIQDKMTSTWTYEVSRANGEKEDVTAEVKVSGLVTDVVAASATAKLSCTIEGVNVTGTATYSITENANLHTKAYAASFGAYPDEKNDTREGDEAVYATNGDTPVPVKGGVATGTKFIDGEGTTLTMMADKTDMKQKIQPNTTSYEEDNKFFPKRFTFGGGSFTSKGASQANRYLKLDVDGPAKLTIYFSTSNAGRGVAVYDGSVDFAALTLESEYIAQSTLQEVNTVSKLEVTLTKAGTYYITTSTKDASYLHYIEVQTEFEKADGQDIPLAAGTDEAWEMKLTTPETIPALKVGDKFTSAVTKIELIKSNSVSCNMTKAEVANWATTATYKIGETAITTDTVITEAMLGNQTISVTCGGYTETYNVVVEAAVDGITGITVTDNLASKEVAAAGGTVAFTKNNVVIGLVGENAAASVTAYTVKVDGTALADSVNLTVATHTIEVTATVTAGQVSATFTETFTITITVAGAVTEQSFLAPDTLPATTAIAEGGIITENALFKAVADGAMEYRIGKDEAAGIPNPSKPVKVTLQDATEKTFKSAISTAKSAGANENTTSVTITAKSKITIRIYAIVCNDSYNSNKAGKIHYSVNGGEVTSVATGSNRQQPAVIEVTLEANQTLTLYGTGDSEGVRMYLFGVEAKKAA